MYVDIVLVIVVVFENIFILFLFTKLLYCWNLEKLTLWPYGSKTSLKPLWPRNWVMHSNSGSTQIKNVLKVHIQIFMVKRNGFYVAIAKFVSVLLQKLKNWLFIFQSWGAKNILNAPLTGGFQCYCKIMESSNTEHVCHLDGWSHSPPDVSDL